MWALDRYAAPNENSGRVVQSPTGPEARSARKGERGPAEGRSAWRVTRSGTRLAACGCAAALALVLTTSEASAAPVGFFSFDVDPAFGPFFTVENLSEEEVPFSNVIVQLIANLVPVYDVSLGDIEPWGVASSFEDLSAFVFDAAILRFGYLDDVVEAAPLVNLSFVCDELGCSSPFPGPVSEIIEYTPNPAPAPVPEPSTLLLVTTGLVAAWRARSRRALSKPPAP